MSHSEASGLSVQVAGTGDWILPEAQLIACVQLAGSRGGNPEGEVSLTFLTDREIRELNLKYLGRDRPTDVIAFSLHDAHEPLLGDVYVGYEQALRQAQDAAIALDEELLRLAIHGTLHVLGYDHPEGENRFESPMFVLQEEILREAVSSRA